MFKQYSCPYRRTRNLIEPVFGYVFNFNGLCLNNITVAIEEQEI